MRLAAVLAALALSACSRDAPQADAPESEASATPGSTAEPIEAEEGSPFASRYTALDIDGCDLVDRQVEGEGATWQCEGFNGIQYWVRTGDGRYDVDAGARDDGAFETLGAFNDLGDTLEWRLREEKPFAVIFRYRDVTQRSKGRTVLAVETIGTNEAPGCRVAQIAGGTPDANARARKLADERAGSFDCAADAMVLVGNAR